MRISLVVRQRIPANVIAKRNVEHKRNQRRSPPTAFSVKLAAWTPRPIVVDEDPAAVVVRRPTPRFIADPRPAVRRTPSPLAVTIWRPIAVNANRRRMWSPDPA